MIFQTEKQLNELGDKLPADRKAAIQNAVDRLKEAHKNQNIDEIEPAIKEIETQFGQAQQDILNAQAQAGAQQPGANPGASAGQQAGPNPDDHVSDVDFEEIK